jgi:hypothetical protein
MLVAEEPQPNGLTGRRCPSSLVTCASTASKRRLIAKTNSRRFSGSCSLAKRSVNSGRRRDMASLSGMKLSFGFSSHQRAAFCTRLRTVRKSGFLLRVETVFPVYGRTLHRHRQPRLWKLDSAVCNLRHARRSRAFSNSAKCRTGSLISEASDGATASPPASCSSVVE